MSNKKGGLDFSAVFIDNAMFTVLDLPDTVSIEEEGPDVFRLNNAYRINIISDNSRDHIFFFR